MKTSSPDERGAWWRGDPRYLQVGFLLAFLAFVLAFRDFTPGPWQVALTLGSALLTQELFVRWRRDPHPGPLSPLITGLSLCLLLRSNSSLVPALAAALAIASKYLIRVRGKHVFNPSNLGIVAVLVLTSDAWVSPSQWGSGLLLAFFLAALGFMVVGRSGRADITLAFLVAHLGLKLLRVAWLGQPLPVFAHQALSGSLIVFAFFMISDPRSTPDARVGRIVFASAVALLAHVLQFRFFWNEALLWALLFVSPLTPLIDLLFRHPRFEWRHAAARSAAMPPPARAVPTAG